MESECLYLEWAAARRLACDSEQNPENVLVIPRDCGITRKAVSHFRKTVMNKAEQEEPKQSRDEQYGEFVALLARHDEAIRRFVRSLLPHRDGIDDVVQETALECWRKYMDFTPESPESAADEFVRWACVIARYKVLSWKRDHARDRHVFRDSVIESLALDSMESLDERAIEEEAVEHCLQKLPVDQQTLVLSVHSPGNSVAEIAKKTGVKARRMYSKVNQLRRLLQECIEQRVAQESANGF